MFTTRKAVTVGAFMTALDVTIVNTALPSIQSGLAGTIAGLQWLGTGYTLAFGGLLLVGGALADRHGARTIFIAGVFAFSAASLACGLASSLLALNVFRVVQGGGAALIVPSTLSLLHETHPDSRARARAIAMWAAAESLKGPDRCSVAC